MKLGGLYVGLTGGADYFLDLDVSDGILCEFIPTDPRFLPLSFVIDENFLLSPPVKTVVCPTAILVTAERFLRADSTMKLIAQREFPSFTASVFLQGTFQASLDFGDNVITLPLSEEYESATIELKENFLIFCGRNHLTIADLSGNILLQTPFLAYSLGETVLTVTIPYFDSRNHSAQNEYSFEEGFPLIRSELTAGFPAGRELTLYALLEGLLIGADVKEFVSESLFSRLDDFKEFLGNYVSVLFLTTSIAGLVYPAGGNLFRATYFTAEYENGKIDNLKEKTPE